MVGKMKVAPERSQFYWMALRQIFFVKQRLFYVVSACLPDNSTGGRLRAALMRMMGARVGAGCYIRSGLIIQESFHRITLGKQVFINANCCLDGSADLVLEDRVQMAFQVTIVTGGHEIGDHADRAGKMRPEPVRIGAGTWIGARATILPGVTLGEGCVVGAGAVVVKSFGPDLLLVGMPAQIRKELEAGPI